MTGQHDLPARLTALADELAGADPDVSPEAVVARVRRQRLTRAGLAAAVALVVAFVVGVPTAFSALSADHGEVAGPGSTTTAATTSADPSVPAASPPADPRTSEQDPELAAEAAAEAAAEQEAAASAAPAAQQDAQPELDAVGSSFGGAPSLSSPAGWDQWLPGDKPYPGASTEDDISTCPHLSDRLGAELGMRFSYWTGTLPGAGGCTWVPVPLSYDGPYDYAYLFTVAFDGGTSVAVQRGSYVMGGGQDEYPGGTPCPSVDVPGGGALVRCAGLDDRYDADWVLIVPDARGAGVWSLSATAQSETGRTSADALAVLASAVAAAYG